MRSLAHILAVALICNELLGYGIRRSFVGKWILNVAQSGYPPRACPKRMIFEIESGAEAFDIVRKR